MVTLKVMLPMIKLAGETFRKYGGQTIIVVVPIIHEFLRIVWVVECALQNYVNNYLEARMYEYRNGLNHIGSVPNQDTSLQICI
jgi:hypothetical protein